MMYRGCCNSNEKGGYGARKEGKRKEGFVLLDAILALALTVFLVTVITQASYGARDMFVHANERNRWMDLYEASSTDFEMYATARWYGNDRVETQIHVDNLLFNAVRVRADVNPGLLKGTPVCSANFTQTSPLGTYESLQSELSERSGLSLTQQNVDLDSTISISRIPLPLSPLLPLTHAVLRNSIAYVSADSTTATDPDLIILDLSNENQPQTLALLSTGPGISSIALAGQRMYAAAASTAAQLHVIRLDALSVPVLEKKFQLPLPYATATPPVGTSIFYDRGFVYLGTEKWDGEEFSIIDVSNSSNPSKVGGIEVGSKINDIYVRDGYAYLGTAAMDQLLIVDVDHPTMPQMVQTFSPSGWQRQEGRSISFFEDRLVFGRTSGGFNIAHDHELFSWGTTTPGSLAPIHSSTDLIGGVYGTLADRRYVYSTTRLNSRGLVISRSDLATTSSKSYPLPIQPQMMICDGDHLYILSHSSPEIYKISFK